MHPGNYFGPTCSSTACWRRLSEGELIKTNCSPPNGPVKSERPRCLQLVYIKHSYEHFSAQFDRCIDLAAGTSSAVHLSHPPPGAASVIRAPLAFAHKFMWLIPHHAQKRSRPRLTNNPVPKQLILSVWGLHVLCVSAWDSSRHFTLLPQSTDMQLSRSERFKLDLRLNVTVSRWSDGAGASGRVCRRGSLPPWQL